jgi:hypothetical protein
MTDLDVAASGNFSIMFPRFKCLVKSVVCDAIDAQLSFENRASFGEYDNLRDERHCDDVTI